ncbi:MAG: hypothetical protein ACREJ3_12855, partial [Polyangiaceae bacterium]
MFEDREPKVTLPRAWTAWAGSRAALVAVMVALAIGAAVSREAAPARDLDALAVLLGREAGGAQVAPASIRWQDSGGVVADAILGRWALFLARAPGDDAGDVWRARVRVSPDGSVTGAGGAHDLTSTPLGDDHELVVRGEYAAFATRAYGQEQSVTLLSLAGEGSENQADRVIDRAMAAITNLQRTGSAGGIGRVDVTFESPARAVGLALGEDALGLTIASGDPRRAATITYARLDLATRDLRPEVPGIHADTATHLVKFFSHWAVDTLRAIPWMGPAPIAWVEDQALALRDMLRQATFRAGRDPTDVVSTAPPRPPVLASTTVADGQVPWPPPSIPTIWKSPQPSEGQWIVPDIPWLRRVPGVLKGAKSPFYMTFVRPDADRPYAKVLLVAMDLRQLDLHMEAGVEDPEPLTGPNGTGRIPRDPAQARLVAAAFNGAFKTEHGHYGMMVRKRVLLPPIPGAATVVVLGDGRVGFGTWGANRTVGGIAGVPDGDIDSFRQNLEPLIDHGQMNPMGRNLWGFTLPGKGAQT